MTEKSSADSTSTALVVGGSGAIGSAIVERLQKNGRRVIVLDRNAPSSLETVFIEADITSETSVNHALDQVSQQIDAPDALICAAGYLSGRAILDLTAQEIQDHLNVNLFGVFYVAKRVARMMMEKGGKILFISSIHGQVGVPNRAAYAISKAALGALARAMAVELAQNRIRVNVLAPGPVNIGIGGIGGMGSDKESTRGFWQQNTPSGRVAYGDEIARFAAVLTSDDASFVTGQTIAIDGGVSILRPHSLSLPRVQS